MTTTMIKSILAFACGLFAANAVAGGVTHFAITVQPAAAGAQTVVLDLGPKATVTRPVADGLHLEITAPEGENGAGRSVLKLLSQQKDGKFKVLHIAGIATFPDEAVIASYGICGGKVVYHSTPVAGEAICK